MAAAVATRTLESELVPDLAGMTLAQARKVLRQAGLEVGKIQFQDQAEWLEENRILAQIPKPGEIFPDPRRVDVTVFRRSLMHYLPGVMQKEDQRAGGLLKRYLAILQHLWTGFQDTLAQVPDCFNPYRTPGEFLPWLASGVGVELEADWPLEKQRALAAHAVELFQWRGTCRGLRQMIRVLAGIEVEVEEHHDPFGQFVLDGKTALGLKTMLQASPRLEHCFTVRLPEAQEKYPAGLLMKIHRIIQREKPAHTQYFLASREARIEYAQLLPWILGIVPLGEACVTAGAGMGNFKEAGLC